MMKLPWRSQSVAVKWPVGSIVLIWRIDRPPHHYRAFEADSYFRPDWITKQYGFDGKNAKFLLIHKGQQ